MLQLRVEEEVGGMAVSSELGERSPAMRGTWLNPELNKEQRLAKIRMSFVLLKVFLTAQVDHSLVGTNVPEDLEVIGVYTDPDQIFNGIYFWVVCRSATFEAIADGNRIPEVDFQYWRKDIIP